MQSESCACFSTTRPARRASSRALANPVNRIRSARARCSAARAATPGSSVLRSWIASRPGAHERSTQLQASSKYQLSDRPAMAEIFQLPSSGAGPAVTPTTAMQVTAVYACIALIAGAIASLPLAFFERTDGDKRRKRIKHDLWWLFNEQPSPLLPAAVFWEYIIATRFLHGDGFALIVRDRNGGKITEVLPLSPLEVESAATEPRSSTSSTRRRHRRAVRRAPGRHAAFLRLRL
jgi:phage portal protein BeeE